MSELYDLPDGWEWKEWRDIVIIKNGKDYKTVLNKNGKYPIYGSGGIMNYSDEYLCNENSVVIGRKGTINSPLFVTEGLFRILCQHLVVPKIVS